jgi:[ribosomal protein S5]-alanine N-acetyltransferase
VTDGPSGRLLGGIGLRLPADGIGEVGYWVRRDARGRGVATRALDLVARWALEEQRLIRVQLTAEPGNVASQRVAEKVGFRREGLLRRYLKIGGERRDGVMFSLLREDL